MDNEQYDTEGWRKNGLYDLLKPLALGKVKLSRQTQRLLEKEMRKAEVRAERRLKPMCRRPGYHERLKSQQKESKRRAKERNPNAEYSLNRRWAQLLKYAKRKGLEVSLTKAEYEELMGPYFETPRVCLVRKDLSKGISLDNVVVTTESKRSKATWIRYRAQKKHRAV